MPLGVYVSVPFCRTKCTFCNFASDVFSRAVFDRYVERVCADIKNARQSVEGMGAVFDPRVDSIYFGGGTPTVLDTTQLERLFATIRQNFEVARNVEFTVECAPGTLKAEILQVFQQHGVNRVSLGVQSFVDQEAASVGRLHKRSVVLDDIGRLRDAGIENISIDLIAGLPHQTGESWKYSLEETIASGVPHVSVYMLEVDDESRLGRELIAGGTKYHAHFVPDDDLTADLYEAACGKLDDSGIRQYEISNFARQGLESRHNLKYWTRRPYLGFGVDAHSMLRVDSQRAVRFATPDSLERFTAGTHPSHSEVSKQESLEESFFLGLRLMRGVDLQELETVHGPLTTYLPSLEESLRDGLLDRDGSIVRLTKRGRMLSNEVFARFISAPVPGI
ncbi:MAG: radical SAM family heme chaperone HemW [Terriglobales bacterium]|jgi:oxygen-independent coproporphyrinogen-3 oxidase